MSEQAFPKTPAVVEMEQEIAALKVGCASMRMCVCVCVCACLYVWKRVKHQLTNHGHAHDLARRNWPPDESQV